MSGRLVIFAANNLCTFSFALTQTKWEAFSNGTRMVRYDEADKIMFDIIKDDWNEFGPNSNSSIRIPTLRTLPGYIEKLKGTK